MISKLKIDFYAIMIVLTVISLCAFFWQRNVAEKAIKKASDYEVQVKELQEKTFKDNSGANHLVKEVIAVNDPRNLKNDSLIMAMIKSLKSEFNVKLKNVQSASSTTIVNNNYLPEVKTGDSCLTYQDQYTTFKKCKGDSMAWHYHITKVNQIAFRERKKILGLKIGKWRYWGDVYSENPKDSIISSKFIMKKQ